MEFQLNVLFVCKGNIFRSMTAEYCCKKYCQDNNIDRISVSSAGTEANPQSIRPILLQKLQQEGIDPTAHVQRKLDKDILAQADIIIPMTVWQRDMIAEHYNVYPKEIILFNEFVEDAKTSVDDIEQAIPDSETNHQAVNNYIISFVDKVQQNMATIIKGIDTRYHIFADMIQHKKKHRGDLPFIPLYETSDALAFSSLDIPRYQDGHVLVIPKKTYKYLHDVPADTMQQMMHITQIIGKAFERHHHGYNILVNTGHAAGQYVYHVHLHIIPRSYSDEITVELWKERDSLTKEEFIKYNNMLKHYIDQVLQEEHL